MQKAKMRIGIICSLDKFINGVRATETKRFLEKRKHNVKLINTYPVHKTSPKLLNLIGRVWGKIPFILKQYILPLQFKLRSNILQKIIKREKFDVVICENAIDSYVLTKKLNCLKIYNCPTPWADELYYSRKLSKYIYKKIKKMEIKIYKKTDYVSFREPYKRYVQKYMYKGKNIFVMNGGCHLKPKEKRAKFAYPLKIIYLGNLEDYWVNLPLLSKLTKLYKYIDVYGAPAPPKKYGLNYRGYASPNVLSKYQFGLITITKDRLRCWGFSAKHPEYLSYGLPVLVPDWRKNLHLFKGSIPYNEKKFLKKIKKYSNKEEWRKMSNLAYNQAKDYDWANALKPLGVIIDNYSKKCT